MTYDLIVVGAGPAGLMAARTASEDGLKVLLLEKKKEISRIRRFCSSLIRVGPAGFSSAKKPTDMEVEPATITFEVDYGYYLLRLKTAGEVIRIDYRGTLGTYYNDTSVSPSGYCFDSVESSEHIYGFQIDKEALLAALLDDTTRAGCEVRSDAKCANLEDSAEGGSVTVTSGGGEETLKATRVVLADGAFSPLMEKLGFNKGRPAAPPPLKFLTYILDRVDSPFPESRHLKLCAPSVHRGQISLGLWAHGIFQLGISTSTAAKVSLPDVLDRAMKDSPFAAWFVKSKVIDRLGCNMSLQPGIREPACGNVICCGDNSAYAETAIRGALGCGYAAAKASKTALEGGDGNKQYNDYWQHAFSFHSPQYRSFGRSILPVARVLHDDEVDTLYKWLQDNKLWGLPGDILSDNKDRFKTELPEIAHKVISEGGRPGGRPTAK